MDPGPSKGKREVLNFSLPSDKKKGKDLQAGGAKAFNARPQDAEEGGSL